ncbi:MAG TPA: 2-succinyl-5-enolpyruvyl-6-hydroxy-3-cyclohexene-1-carboxylic-acid synthase, partial [Cyclobacteriaceae bacterium]|nr:2-succinyl-5-enolpyruvyl-6-hydroxy-3-cyclohexene-1-carboxylic-acid synthase [Cyclobacteriaceae bacterium]
MAHQQVFDIAAICASHGIKLAVICPGSRSAPILIGFTRHPEIKCYTITDERSAAFIALGLAQSSQNPVALICTSGTAAYNFAPAVAEAFFSHVPLLVITADRPPEWIDQLDGQTIRQENIYRSHVKSSYNFPADFNHADAIWHAQRMVNEAIIHSKALPQGPVHINVPLREPLYSAETSSFKYSEKLQVFKSNTAFPIIDDAELKSLAEQWHDYPHKLLVIGQLPHDKVLREAIVNFSQKHHLPVIADVISNQHGAPELISYQDLFLGQMPEARMQALRPDLLITIGQSLISKNLKLFLRKHKAQAHWHVQAHLPVADTFRQLTYIIQSSPVDALKKLTAINAENTFAQQQQNNYFNLWQLEQRHVQKI